MVIRSVSLDEDRRVDPYLTTVQAAHVPTIPGVP
jgi:hypothetical protein